MCDEDPLQKRENRFPQCTGYGRRRQWFPCLTGGPFPGRPAAGREKEGLLPCCRSALEENTRQHGSGQAARWGQGYFGEPAFTFKVSGSMSRR